MKPLLIMVLRFMAALFVSALVFVASNMLAFFLFKKTGALFGLQGRNPSETLFFVYFGDYALSALLGVVAGGSCFAPPNRFWGTAALAISLVALVAVFFYSLPALLAAIAGGLLGVAFHYWRTR